MGESIKKSITLIILLVAIASVVLSATHRLRWATGLLVATAWSITNFLLLMNALKAAVLQKSKGKIFLILFVKFPILYLIGYLILFSKLFPLSSLLTGLATLLILGALTVCQKQT